MKNMTKDWFIVAMALVASASLCTSVQAKKLNHKKVTHKKDSEYAQKKSGKEPFTIQRGDCSLTFGGKTKIEHYTQKNASSLNQNLPDQFEYFKHKIDLIFDFAYGEKEFEHKAVQAYVDIYHKGVWGRGAVYADSDGSSPEPVKLSESLFGNHRHSNGKPMIWIKEGWLAFSGNAIAGKKGKQNLHILKLGWFPFELGRGIALGAAYGLTRNGSLGLYSYVEDKSAPGINLAGEIIADVLNYDIYYSKFEERNKSLGDTTAEVKEQLIGHQDNPVRGVAKDNEVIAGRMKWKAINNGSCGTLELEPYVFYNEASDQKVETLADAKTELGAFGLSAEHKNQAFEIGGEVAFNFGNQILRPLDRNKIQIKRDGVTGNLVEQFSHIGTLNMAGEFVSAPVGAANGPAVTAAEIRLSDVPFTVHTPIPGTRFYSKANRIRPGFKNKLGGWMGVIDCAYNFEEQNVKLAAAYGYASGDQDPTDIEKDKTYKGFIGLHEIYSGKRVRSVYFLDERILNLPSALGIDDKIAVQDLAFTDLQHVGLGATWKPTVATKKLMLNPNIMTFWKTHISKKFDKVTARVTTEDASRYLGTEINVISKCELLKDLNIFGNFAIFVPGGFFQDISGLPIDTKFSDFLAEHPENDLRTQNYGLGSNAAYHMNVGFDYAF